MKPQRLQTKVQARLMDPSRLQTKVKAVLRRYCKTLVPPVPPETMMGQTGLAWGVVQVCSHAASYHCLRGGRGERGFVFVCLCVWYGCEGWSSNDQRHKPNRALRACNALNFLFARYFFWGRRNPAKSASQVHASGVCWRTCGLGLFGNCGGVRRKNACFEGLIWVSFLGA